MDYAQQIIIKGMSEGHTSERRTKTSEERSETQERMVKQTNKQKQTGKCMNKFEQTVNMKNFKFSV